jgi:prepilin-type N-terminal cleavage/methylation domain-containing protein
MTKTNQGGFSLVETLVAITILLIVITGPMTISSTTARSTSYSSEQVIAFFLAQEGAELAQKARDDYVLDYFYNKDNNITPNPSPWTRFTDVTSAGVYKNCFATGCGLELKDVSNIGELNTVINCTSGCLLYYNNTSSAKRAHYSYIAGTNEATKYSRVIKMSVVAGGVKVVSTVTWRTGSQRNSQKAEVETFLFNVYAI